jgi:prepilin-type N-terminal cleavage/methylation domain-containing protein
MLIQQANYRQRENAAFTLVELLVVIAILLLITVTAIPVLSPTDVQKVRDAAITVSGMITRVKSAAAEQETRGAGLWLQPLAGVDTPGAVLDMYTSLSLDPYAGDDPEAAGVYVYKPYGGTVTFPDATTQPLGFPPPYPGNSERSERLRLLFFPKQSCASVGALCSKSSRARVANGDTWDFKLVQANSINSVHLPQPYRAWNTPPIPYHPDHAGDPAYDYRVPANWEYPERSLVADCDFVGVLQPGLDLLGTNTYFGFRPGDLTPLEQATTVFSIDRPNTRAPTPPLTLPAGYAIDLAWSGWGNVLFRANLDIDDPSVAGFGFLADMVVAEPVQIMFTKDGKPDELIYRKNQLIYQTIERIEASLRNLGDVFLLVGRADRCGKPVSEAAYADSDILGANWQYPDSRWIRISRITGQVTISEPYPNATTLKDSLIYANAGIPAGRG